MRPPRRPPRPLCKASCLVLLIRPAVLGRATAAPPRASRSDDPQRPRQPGRRERQEHHPDFIVEGQDRDVLAVPRGRHAALLATARACEASQRRPWSGRARRQRARRRPTHHPVCRMPSLTPAAKKRSRYALTPNAWRDRFATLTTARASACSLPPSAPRRLHRQHVASACTADCFARARTKHNP